MVIKGEIVCLVWGTVSQDDRARILEVTLFDGRIESDFRLTYDMANRIGGVNVGDYIETSLDFSRLPIWIDVNGKTFFHLW